MSAEKSLKQRVLGALAFGLLGFALGAGTGVVGGAFGAIAGVGLFTVIGLVYGWSAGPDIASLLGRFWR